MIVRNRLLNYDDCYIFQDTEYFKFSLDSVLLANFVTINKRDKKILDLATGNAPIPMLLTYRTNAKIYGVEIQRVIYNLGIISVKENNMHNQITLINDDAKNLTNDFESDTFDVITCNPPYFKTTDDNFKNNNKVKSLARHEDFLNLEDVLVISRKLLKNNGRIALVHRTERFVEILNTMQKYNIEPKRVRFIYSKENKNSNLVLIEGIKNGKPGLKLLPPLIIYDADGNYTKEVSLMFGEWLYVTK